MNTTRAVVVSALTGIAMLLAPQFSPAQTNSRFTGTWKGKMNGLPGVDLKIGEAGGKVSGTIVFYHQGRSSANEPWHAGSASRPLPLLVPHAEGNTLVFEAQHHKCDGCAELGPNVRFRMQLTGPNEARLWNLGNQDEKAYGGPGLKLVREPEPASPQKPAQKN